MHDYKIILCTVHMTMRMIFTNLDFVELYETDFPSPDEIQSMQGESSTHVNVLYMYLYIYMHMSIDVVSVDLMYM